MNLNYGNPDIIVYICSKITPVLNKFIRSPVIIKKNTSISNFLLKKPCGDFSGIKDNIYTRCGIAIIMNGLM